MCPYGVIVALFVIVTCVVVFVSCFSFTLRNGFTMTDLDDVLVGLVVMIVIIAIVVIIDIDFVVPDTNNFFKPLFRSLNSRLAGS